MNSYKKRCPNFILKYLLHSDFLGNEPELLIKAEGAFVASPDVQGQIVAAAFLCKIANKAVKLFADMKPTAALVNAKIVNIESFYVGQDIAVFVADKNAKGIADNGVGFVNGDEYRSSVISDDRKQLFVGIFFCVCFEYVGATVVVYLKHLAEKVVYLFKIGAFCASDSHFMWFLCIRLLRIILQKASRVKKRK